jgi:hypothetical protein
VGTVRSVRVQHFHAQLHWVYTIRAGVWIQIKYAFITTRNPQYTVQYNFDDFLAELKGRLQTAHQVARERLISRKEKSKEYYDKNTKETTLKVGDKVLLYDETVRRGRSKKLSSQWLSPYEVISIDRVNSTIKKGRHRQKVHLNRLKHYY